MFPVDAGPGVLFGVVVVTPAPLPRSGSAPSLTARGRPVDLVRALLGGTLGQPIDAPGCDACLIFERRTDALDAALALVSLLRRLPAELGTIEVGLGLTFATTSHDEATAAGVARIAASARGNQILLGESLATVVREDPPDRHMVRSDGAVSGLGERAYALVTAADDIPNNLGRPSSGFVGRESEIAEVRGLLDSERTVTITGVPGSGKSRLAREIAERVLGRYPDGAWLVGLAPVRDPKLVMSAVADALGLPVPPGRSTTDVVAAHLEDRRMLLVVDDLDHVLSAATELEAVVRKAVGVRVIVTSRSPLHLAGERVSVVAPFDVSDPDARTRDGQLSPAVDLFVQRAMAARPGLELSDADLPPIVELCRRLDGLPLAIELAAARMRTLSLPAILEHLDERLGLLTGGSTERPHHESLGAAIAWSHDLLDPSTQRLYRRLSVFRGGWTLAAATALSRIEPVSEVRALDSIAALHDVSLLVRLGPDTSAPRFTMLESLRSFADERLKAAGETDAAQRQHAMHYLDLVIRTAPRLTGPDQSAALDGLAVEHDNIRAALGYLVRSDPVEALRLVAAIWRFWQMRGHLVEGSRWVADALQAAGGDAPDGERAGAMAAAGGLAYWRGDLLETEDRYAQGVALRRRMGDPVGIADALFDLAFVFDPALRPPPEDPERTGAGIRLVEEAHELYVHAGHEPGIARSEWLLGSVVAGRDIEAAKRLLSSSVERFRRLDDRFGLGWALHSYGLTLLRSVDSDSAAAAFGEALRLFSTAGDGSAIALLLEDFSEVAKAEGDALRASRLQGAASGARRTTEAELVVSNPLWQIGDAVPRGLIDPGALEQAWADGRAMSQAEAIAYALRSAAETIPDQGLRVNALGPLVVERAGQPVSDWGGPKAGGRHALAIFAFLMDRGERGVSKDEFIEVLWPDAEVQQADLNFHRTLGGLRSTLADGREATNPGGQTESVVFSNGRYHLASAVVGWLDVAEFQQRLLNAMEATDEISAIRGLEAARALYRGDYLDDCPLYGDSPFVEERRRFLRGRLVDALVDLGRRYERRQETNLASSRFREALSITDGDCPSAMDGLERLGVAAV